ncbi:MAG: hypothetical protein GTO22_23085 [Gemmatimonadales bacterium]|nr:hypothetical protein [Gemmatimonadales bacterium]
MLNQDQIELIHREIDGANTPAESAAFRSLIEEDPEAKAFEADLRYVTLLLDRVEDGEPPRHLKRAILDALPQQVRATSGWEAFVNHSRTVVDGFRKRPRFALASSLCVGLVAGFAAYAALEGTILTDQSDTVSLTGTFFEPRTADESGTIDEVTIDIDGGSGRVGVRRVQDIVFVELELDAEQELEIRLTFDEGTYDLRGFSRLRSEAGSYLTAEPGRIRITTSGANTHTFALNHEGPVSPLALSLFDDGKEVFATTLYTRKQSQGG